MTSLKVMLVLTACALVVGAAVRIGYDLFRAWLAWRRDPSGPIARPRLRGPARLMGLAAAVLLVHQSIAIVPSGYAAVRVSQLSGTRPGTLSPGIHLVKPLVERVALFDTRDRVLSTSGAEAAGTGRARMGRARMGQARARWASRSSPGKGWRWAWR